MAREIMTPKIKSLIEFNSRLDAILFATQPDDSASDVINVGYGPEPLKPGYEKVLGYAVKIGTKKHAKLVAEKKHYDDLAKSEVGRGRSDM